MAYVGSAKALFGRGQSGMEAKKTAARGAKSETRVSMGKVNERAPLATKRPSAPPPVPAATKKKDKSIPPPAVANDNDRAKRMATAPMGRGRLPTGSLHTEAREPAGANLLKQRLTALVQAQQRLGELKRSANRHFYEIGEILHKVREERLFEVKGYASLEAFVERELNLGQQFCTQSVRIFETFLPSAAQTLGFSRLCAALAVLEEEPSGMTAIDAIRGARSAIPPHKQ